ncbi:hypothetical protein CN679_13670 [Bacillus pseudomycoides]|nr:hypothetical protein CN679_13670 [Bacillus pseudomycoides]
MEIKFPPNFYTHIFYLSRYLRAVRPPPQNSAKAKKLGMGSTDRKSPIWCGLIISGGRKPH